MGRRTRRTTSAVIVALLWWSVAACSGGGGVGTQNNNTPVDATVASDGAVDANVLLDGGGGQDSGMGDDAGPGVDAGQPDAGPVASPECTQPGDCTLHSDCCECLALAPGETPPPCNIPTCFVDTCTSWGVDPTQPLLCAVGHCSVGMNCDHDQVACMMPTPVCDPGFIPSVSGMCWGPCVRASECAFVPSCSQCDPAHYLCVAESAWVETTYCVELPTQCAQNMTCACLSDAVCRPPFDVCTDLPAANEIQCVCPTC